ncbi:YggT family protein [Treponema sp. C6A8]|uniref:YggT family protein n=1 Tax=Treponema sp. C6A8 TaxID=1410609 RepID=UPI000482C384|nr:YggT family protein [Treponema sp. C6A8]
MISAILGILSAAVTIYTMLCFLNIIISWFPGAKFTGFGKAISALTDPYMNFFSRSGWLTFGNIDFSPILSIGILTVISSILGGITSTGRLYVGGILAIVIKMLWNTSSSILSILYILLFVRWIVLLISHGYTPYNSGWNNVDQFLQRLAFRVAGTFVKANLSYQKALLITILIFTVILGFGTFFIAKLEFLCYQLPF